MRPFERRDVGQIVVFRSGEALAQKARKRSANVMQIAGARWMRALKVERELAEIVRAHESLDHREADRERLNESFAQIVPINVDALRRIDAVRDDLRHNGVIRA